MKNRWVVPIVLLAAACGPPVIYDTDGRPVAEPAFMASVDGGWLAVDSSDGGVRAILEVRVPVPEGDVVGLDQTDLHLWTGSGYPVSPVRLNQGSLQCRPSVLDRVECQGKYGDPQACPREGQADAQECYYLLCAEFSLLKLPSVYDPVVLSLGGSLTILQLMTVR
jgi:hypothetical protein